MKKTIKVAALVLFVVFALAQFIRPERANPPIVEAETLEFSAQVPEDVEKILARSCNDCHTNRTNYPWYSNVTPFNFFLAHHIEEGRAQLNFSVWNQYETARKRRKLNEICGQVEEGLMPLPSYLWIHRDARLSEDDVKTLCGWTENERARLAAGAAQ
jgi:hypothetical protein